MKQDTMFTGFDTRTVQTAECSYFIRIAGSGPPLLLLHGFPETHLMWRDVAPRLAGNFTVVCADLRGYGQSGCPPSAPDHLPYSKRAMAADLVRAMDQLGHRRFAIAGHDRGGRVAYRMALDHPDRVSKLAVLDILPTSTVWDRADVRLALAFWPWSLLAQAEPLPERLIDGAADAIIANALGQWGSKGDAFPAEVRQAYVDALREPEHVHAICEEYRAAASIDRTHDAGDQKAGKRIQCPVLALWSEQGGLQNWYTPESGPLILWRTWANDVTGGPVTGGHFFPEEFPDETAAALRGFLRN
jgi:haloacetate dehalogenase